MLYNEVTGRVSQIGVACRSISHIQKNVPHIVKRDTDDIFFILRTEISIKHISIGFIQNMGIFTKISNKKLISPPHDN